MAQVTKPIMLDETGRAIVEQLEAIATSQQLERYIKEAAVSSDGNTLTLTKKDNSEVHFQPTTAAPAGAVSYAVAQYLSDLQKEQARTNINASIATPSGDPLHYVYVKKGAIYNDTGANIQRTDDFGEVVTHEPGKWYLNGIGDLTTDEMREIYVLTGVPQETIMLGKSFRSQVVPLTDGNLRTTFTLCNRCITGGGVAHMTKEFTTRCYYALNQLSKMRVIQLAAGIDEYIIFDKFSGYIFYTGGYQLRKVIGIIDVEYMEYGGPSERYFFGGQAELEEIRIMKLHTNWVSCNESPLLSTASILYAIQNETATSNITITLHPTAYARAMADADVQAALQSHPRVSLASA